MTIERVDARTYDSVIGPNLSHIFNSVSFNALNAAKCDDLHYLLFKDGKYRLGVILGQKDGVFQSPFSAPFGGFEAVRVDVQLQHIDAAIELLKEYVPKNGGHRIRFILPPLFYSQSVLSKSINSLYRNGFSLETADVNHVVDLDEWSPKSIKRQSNLKEMEFRVCAGADEKALVYDVIRQNRAWRGYPLRMTWEQVTDTVKIVDADFFLVSAPEGKEAASALVYHVAKGIVQVIYWGNLPGFDVYRPMHYLALCIFKYYKERGIRIVDIGPSSADSIPNYGLCDFKERIGCFVHPKFSFEWTCVSPV